MGNLISASAVSVAYKKVYNTVVKPKRKDGHHKTTTRTYCQCGVVSEVSSEESTTDQKKAHEESATNHPVLCHELGPDGRYRLSAPEPDLT